MTTGRARTGAIAGLLLIGLATGCSGTTAGQGTTLDGPRGQSAGPATSDTPTSGPPITTGLATPSAPSASGPTLVTPPPTCPAAACPVSASSTLAGDLRVILRSNPGFHAGEGATIVELTKADLPVYWYSMQGELPGQLDCLYSAVRASCIVVDFVGAHGSKATLFRLDGATLVKGAQVTSDSPQIQARDLNDDGWIDVEALQNTYQPDYATGAVYWQTWTSNGSSLTPTGCTPASHTPPAAPLAPATGRCP